MSAEVIERARSLRRVLLRDPSLPGSLIVSPAELARVDQGVVDSMLRLCTDVLHADFEAKQ